MNKIADDVSCFASCTKRSSRAELLSLRFDGQWGRGLWAFGNLKKRINSLESCALRLITRLLIGYEANLFILLNANHS